MFKTLVTLSVLIASLFFSGESFSSSRSHIAPVDTSAWKLEKSLIMCKLTHDIPGYGRAHFQKEVGKPLHFFMTVAYGPKQSKKKAVDLIFNMPPWQHDNKQIKKHRFTLFAGNQVIRLRQHAAQLLIDQLLLGRQAQFSHEDWFAGKGFIKTSLSPVNFRKGHDEFHQCLLEMPPVTLARLNRTVVYFENGSAFIDNNGIERLSLLKHYIPQIQKAKEIKLYGFTDSIGRISVNKVLSERRINAVKEQLIDWGIPQEKFTLWPHGERYARGSNNLKQGRAQNRRVEIQIVW